ncbi:hypothetical protein B296_00015998 [Ensete ventricosum]|uniref:Uncharacterized protein n=1 Tax=Ensete ventricosum TaxID=4639 RepID=A0A426YPB0_ENSVE|nr:hypothetical protein B296_00015998 [Ensete ventricosum]
MLASLCPPLCEPRGWAPRGLSLRALLIFTFLHRQNLDGDVLVGPLQHYWYSHGGSLHKRPEEARRHNPDHESLDDQRWVCIGNALISSMKWARYWPRCSSSFCLISRRDATAGFGHALERKLASNSLVKSYRLTHWVRAPDAWLHRSRGPDPTKGRNGANCRRSKSSEVVHSMAALLLSGTGRLPEAVGLAVG